MAGLGVIVGGGAAGLLAGGVFGGVENARNGEADWTPTKGAIGAAAGLAVTFAGLVASRNIPAVERAFAGPIIGLASLAITGAFAAGGFAAASTGANLVASGVRHATD